MVIDQYLIGPAAGPKYRQSIRLVYAWKRRQSHFLAIVSYYFQSVIVALSFDQNGRFSE